MGRGVISLSLPVVGIHMIITGALTAANACAFGIETIMMSEEEGGFIFGICLVLLVPYLMILLFLLFNVLFAVRLINYNKEVKDVNPMLKTEQIQKNLRRIGSQDKCCVCMDNSKNCMFEPCNHMTTCYECGLALFSSWRPTCPICRQGIRKV